MESEVKKPELASSGKRIGAFFIDTIPIVILVFLVFYFLFDFNETLHAYLNRGDQIEPRIRFLKQRNVIREIAFLVWILYCIFMESSDKGGTYGKQLMKIRVVDAKGSPLDLSKSLIRNLSKILSYAVLFLGFIWILFDSKRQGWHDKIAKTYIIND
jgi:uncharacterized RDD family membrane protein YckC